MERAESSAGFQKGQPARGKDSVEPSQCFRATRDGTREERWSLRRFSAAKVLPFPSLHPSFSSIRQLKGHMAYIAKTHALEPQRLSSACDTHLFMDDPLAPFFALFVKQK